MDMYVKDLPIEIQNKIFYMCAEHPVAKIFKDRITIRHVSYQGEYVPEHLAFFWSDTDEWFKSTFLSVHRIKSFIIENDVKLKTLVE